MAENKKSFLLYADQISTFVELSDAEAGVLIKHIFKYVNDMSPEAPDRITKLLFEPIKASLKRDLVKYEKRRKQTSEAGTISAKQRALKASNKKQRTLTNVERTLTNSTDSVSDSDIKEIYNKDFISVVETWLKYKKERKESYKSKTGLRLFCKNLYLKSGGDSVKALSIIENSMSNNWAGIFDLKQTETKTTKVEESDRDYQLRMMRERGFPV